MRILFTILALSLTAPAFAEKPEFSGQVQSVRLYNTPKTSNPALLKETPKAESEMDAADRVWEKYKELAMGVDQPPEETAEKPEKETDKKETETTKAKEDKPAPVGMQSMIQAYQKNKEQRSQMQSISFKGSKKEE